MASFSTIIVFACLAVLAVLLVGLGTFARGGETNRRWGNRIMQLRVVMQLAAVLLIVALAWAVDGTRRSPAREARRWSS
jgi:hypothetical protein